MTELNGLGGFGGCYLLDKRTIKLHIQKAYTFFSFEQHLALRNSVRFWAGALAYVPDRDPQRQTDF
jgi:hypothetical protein